MLDTNICIYIQKNKPEHVREKFKQFSVGDLALSSITVSDPGQSGLKVLDNII